LKNAEDKPISSVVGVADGQDAKSPRVEILGPLRGLAALAVTWLHLTSSPTLVKTEWLRASGTYGWHGVDMFFVISGFVIPYSMFCGGYRPRQHFGRFLAKRLIRLEPPYLVSIIVIIMIFYLSALRRGVAGSELQFSTTQLLLHVGYLNTFFGYPWLNDVYWTLGIEFQYYLFVALVYPLFTARRPVTRAVVVASMAAVPFLVPTPMLVFHYLGLFTLGILTFQYHIGLVSGKVFVPAVAFVAVITAVCQGLPNGLAGGATALVIAFVPMPRFSVMRVFVFLGVISYSLYLLHLPIMGRVVNLRSQFGDGLAWELGLIMVTLAVCVAAATAFNRFIERPVQRLSSRIKYWSSEKICSTTSKEDASRISVAAGAKGE
jgi:peptidoglycan/LPS O-acetylase OafA/YrhL